MPVPLKSKLSYAWERNTRKDMLYSQVFEKPLTPKELGNPFDTHAKPKRSMWIKATPIEGKPDAFKMDICRYDTFGYIGTALAYQEITVPGVCTRKEAVTMIRAHEEAWRRDMQPMRRQPFADFIPPKFNP